MYDEKTWTQLNSLVSTGSTVRTDCKLKQEVDLCWKERKSWWPKYHFRLRKSFKFSEEVKAVMVCKAKIAEHFLGKGGTLVTRTLTEGTV